MFVDSFNSLYYFILLWVLWIMIIRVWFVLLGWVEMYVMGIGGNSSYDLELLLIFLIKIFFLLVGILGLFWWIILIWYLSCCLVEWFRLSVNIFSVVIWCVCLMFILLRGIRVCRFWVWVVFVFFVFLFVIWVFFFWCCLWVFFWRDLNIESRCFVLDVLMISIVV